MKSRNIVCLLFLLFALMGCDPEDCLSTKTNNVIFGFYHLESKEEYSIRVSQIKAEASDFILIDSVVLAADTLVLNPSDTITGFYFELVDYDIDTVYADPPENTEILKLDTLKIDTLRRSIKFSYSKLQRIISPECGVEQAIKDLKLLEYDFDSVAIVDQELDRFDKQNVQIYF